VSLGASLSFEKEKTVKVEYMKFKGLLFSLIALTIALGLLVSCSFSSILPSDKEKDPETKAKSYYEFFDTVSVIISYKGDSAEEFSENCNEVSSLLSDYHKLFDIYYEYEGVNNIKTINKNAGREPVKVDERLIDFLLYCKEIYTLTGGKTNVAMGSVLKLWHDERERYDPDYPEEAKLPSTEALNAAKAHTDINSLIIDKEAGTVLISDPQMRLDVGAVGKGYATERAAELLINKGVKSYVLNIGGNIVTIGTKPSGDGWDTGITNPDKSSSEPFVCRVKIKDTSLVTSGNYERFYVVDGVPYHHIIDPETLMPANYFASVSIFVKDSALADALSTALFCMNYEDGKALAESLGIDVIWVRPDGQILMTEGIELINK
jgi:thiamine biosynthesis lipoprotein